MAIINLSTGPHQLIFLPFELTVAIINLHTGAHLLIFQSFELNVAIINLRTGEHQLIFLSFELTVAIINLRGGAHLLIFQFFATKRFNYINASHQVHTFASEEQIFDNIEPFKLFIFSVML